MRPLHKNRFVTVSAWILTTLFMAVSFAGIPAFKARAGMDPKVKSALKPLIEGAEGETVGDMYHRLYTYFPVEIRPMFDPVLKGQGHHLAPEFKLNDDGLMVLQDGNKAFFTFETRDGLVFMYINGTQVNDGKTLSFLELTKKIEGILQAEYGPKEKKMKVSEIIFNLFVPKSRAFFGGAFGGIMLGALGGAMLGKIAGFNPMYGMMFGGMMGYMFASNNSNKCSGSQTCLSGCTPVSLNGVCCSSQGMTGYAGYLPQYCQQAVAPTHNYIARPVIADSTARYAPSMAGNRNQARRLNAPTRTPTSNRPTATTNTAR